MLFRLAETGSASRRARGTGAAAALDGVPGGQDENVRTVLDAIRDGHVSPAVLAYAAVTPPWSGCREVHEAGAEAFWHLVPQARVAETRSRELDAKLSALIHPDPFIALMAYIAWRCRELVSDPATAQDLSLARALRHGRRESLESERKALWKREDAINAVLDALVRNSEVREALRDGAAAALSAEDLNFVKERCPSLFRHICTSP